MQFVSKKNVPYVTYVCDGCWNCCDHCLCGPNQTPAPCDLKSGHCKVCEHWSSKNESRIPPLRFFKTHDAAFAPQWGTLHAACFDLRACLAPGIEFTVFNQDNSSTKYRVPENDIPNTDKIMIAPGQRVMIPTGLIFDIPIGYSVRIHSRSGTALKRALTLVNHEGIIDSDYVEPTYLLMYNGSSQDLVVEHGERLAQGEMIPDLAYEVLETITKPQVKTDRVGGFGSTGVK
jgi:dUTP pyrophosphatase